jgi:hypothetical protein
MALNELFRNDIRTRRSMIAAGGSAVLTAGLAPVGLLGFVGAARAQIGDQPDWRFCNKCNAMFFDGYPTNKGHCPAGGTHVAQGFRFLMHFDAGKGDGGRRQYDWRFCGKCSAMFFDGYPNKGTCPAGGAHSAAGWMFGLVHQSPTGWQQNEWRFCNKCEVLFYDGYPSKGHCAAGGGHVSQGYVFYINTRNPSRNPVPPPRRSGRGLSPMPHRMLVSALPIPMARSDRVCVVPRQALDRENARISLIRRWSRAAHDHRITTIRPIIHGEPRFRLPTSRATSLRW